MFLVPMTPSPARRRPSQRRSRETYEAIVEAAAQVFEREGYAAGTTNRIADRAGVSVGSLYQYFADKDAVLHAVCERHLDDAAGMLARELGLLSSDPEPRDAVRALTGAVVSLHRDRPRLHRLLFEEAPLSGELRERVGALEQVATNAVATYLARRPCPPADPTLTASLVIQAVEAWSHRFVIYPGPATGETEFVGAVSELLVGGL